VKVSRPVAVSAARVDDADAVTVVDEEGQRPLRVGGHVADLPSAVGIGGLVTSAVGLGRRRRGRSADCGGWMRKEAADAQQANEEDEEG
jgi:hypothetical protein